MGRGSVSHLPPGCPLRGCAKPAHRRYVAGVWHASSGSRRCSDCCWLRCPPFPLPLHCVTGLAQHSVPALPSALSIPPYLDIHRAAAHRCCPPPPVTPPPTPWLCLLPNSPPSPPPPPSAFCAVRHRAAAHRCCPPQPAAPPPTPWPSQCLTFSTHSRPSPAQRSPPFTSHPDCPSPPLRAAARLCCPPPPATPPPTPWPSPFSTSFTRSPATHAPPHSCPPAPPSSPRSPPSPPPPPEGAAGLY